MTSVTGHAAAQVAAAEAEAADPRVVTKLGDGVEVLDPHEPEPERDEFDDLRDALRDITG